MPKYLLQGEISMTDKEYSIKDPIKINENNVLAQRFGIPDTSPWLSVLQEQAKQPSELESISWDLGMPATLLNIHMAGIQDYSSIRLGIGVFIPAMISRENSGRKSVLNLSVGEKTFTGVFITNQGIALRYWTRESGKTVEIRTGDRFREEWVTREGEVVVYGTGLVEEVNRAEGTATLNMTLSLPGVNIGDINVPPVLGGCKCKCRVILWSLWCTCDCECPKEVVG
jgi:hypothetical protein